MPAEVDRGIRAKIRTPINFFVEAHYYGYFLLAVSLRFNDTLKLSTSYIEI